MLDDLWQIRGLTQLVVYGIFVVIAFMRGAGPERYLASILFAMLAVDRIWHELFGANADYHRVDIWHLSVDIAVFFAIMPVAIHANRLYPLWIGAAQLIALVSHFARVLMIGVDGLAYAIMDRLPSYIQLIAMAVGLACHISRRKRLGNYRSWRT